MPGRESGAQFEFGTRQACCGHSMPRTPRLSPNWATGRRNSTLCFTTAHSCNASAYRLRYTLHVARNRYSSAAKSAAGHRQQDTRAITCHPTWVATGRSRSAGRPNTIFHECIAMLLRLWCSSATPCLTRVQKGANGSSPAPPLAPPTPHTNTRTYTQACISCGHIGQRASVADRTALQTRNVGAGKVSREGNRRCHETPTQSGRDVQGPVDLGEISKFA